MEAELFDGMMVKVDERTDGLGGSFEEGVAYAPEPLRWTFARLQGHAAPILIDGGASTGSYSLLAKFIPTLIVYAFEPVRETFQVLQANVALNKLLTRVRPYRMALSDQEGEDVLHVTTPPHMAALSWVGAKTNPIDGGQPFSEEMVATITIDRLCTIFGIRPTLIKLDVQGLEIGVLEGAQNTILAHHPDLVVEYCEATAAQYGYHPKQIGEWLSVWGYTWNLVTNTDYLATYEAAHDL
jgi:FkbM family methyltransferase